MTARPTMSITAAERRNIVRKPSNSNGSVARIKAILRFNNFRDVCRIGQNKPGNYRNAFCRPSLQDFAAIFVVWNSKYTIPQHNANQILTPSSLPWRWNKIRFSFRLLKFTFFRWRRLLHSIQSSNTCLLCKNSNLILYVLVFSSVLLH